MDPRERADATLARARARGAFVVTPESAISPMDAANTLQIPRSVVSAIDEGDPEMTTVVPAATSRGRHRAVPAQAPPAEDEVPAIAQEAMTQVLPTPPPAARKPREGSAARRREPEPPSERQTTPLPWATQPPPPPPPSPPEPEQLDGLVPTVKQPPTQRSTLSQRLDG